MTSYLEIAKQTRNSRANLSVAMEKTIGSLDASAMSGVSSSIASFVSNDSRGQRRQVESYEQFKNWVFVCVNYIARKVAMQPIIAGEQVGAEANPERSAPSRTKRVKNRDLPSSIQKSVGIADVEVISNHAVLDALSRPNYLQDSFQFRYMSTINLLLTGEAYWLLGEDDEGVDDNGNKKLEMWAIPTHWMVPDHKNGPYSGFRFKPPGTVGRGTELPRESVARSYLANPASLTSVWSPLHAVLRAAKVDDHIMYSQESMFARGINPNVILTIGQRRGPDGKPTGSRAKLTGAQRRQIVRSVREVWGNTVNYGDPAIIDGLIESVHKLNSAPNEMDWTNSSTVNKSRIMQAFGVNPIVVGEIVGANRAQATEAEKSVASNTLNPILDIFSSTMTTSLGPLYSDPERLLLWIEEVVPVDIELRDKRWLDGSKQGLVDIDEVRGELYGLPPRDEPRGILLSSHTGWQQARETVVAYSDGKMERDSAIKMLMMFLEIEEDEAEELVGEERDPIVPLAIAPPMNEDEGDDAEEEEGGDEEVEVDEGVADSVRSVTASLYETIDAFEAAVIRNMRPGVEDGPTRSSATEDSVA